MPSEWIEEARRKRAEHGLSPIDLYLAGERFGLYWQARAGAGATKRDWRATWVNWALQERTPPNERRPNGGIVDAARRVLAAGSFEDALNSRYARGEMPIVIEHDPDALPPAQPNRRFRDRKG
jgi:hypothetical protein